MRIGEASRVSGASARSLRHYEDEGLIVPGRSGNGFRDYCRSTVDRVLVIRSLLESGLPVRLIREALPRLVDGAESGADVVHGEFLDEVQAHRDRLVARIAVLSDQQAALDAYLRDARRTGLPPSLDPATSVTVLPSAHGDRRAAAHR
ncbi:MerR family transcriptional regulator [Streptomyces sp. NPDC056465]|uniref:MerR family transcriptional regulator n=1 Tax=Streptomyces sp. NPDC056465 TaxID=3345829 RepID=UPI00367FFD4B